MDSPLLAAGAAKTDSRALSLPQKATLNIASRRYILICVLMHGVLLIVHIALLCIWARHYEHHVTFAFNTFSASFLPTLLTIMSQIIGVVSTRVHY